MGLAAIRRLATLCRQSDARASSASKLAGYKHLQARRLPLLVCGNKIEADRLLAVESGKTGSGVAAAAASLALGSRANA